MIDIHGEEKLIDLLKSAGENYRRAQAAREVALAAGREPPVSDGTLVCTGHTSKGMESDRVWLSDNFNGPAKREESQTTRKDNITVAPETARLLYVAMTRARCENNPLCVNGVREVYKAMDPRHADTSAPDSNITQPDPRRRKSSGHHKAPKSHKLRLPRKREPEEFRRACGP
ncbi:MAG: 3'-5' exonuclease [Acidiferrobacter sp.]